MSDDSRPVVLVDGVLATMAGSSGDGHGYPTGELDEASYGLVRDAAIVLRGKKIEWLGPIEEMPGEWRSIESMSLGGRLVTPGLVECHTHLLYAGDRRPDFAARAAGRSYEELGGAGLGIQSTVEATRSAGDDTILDAATRRAWWFIRQGVTTLEVKTGYGQDTAGELRLLRLANELRAALPITVRVTLLAGHNYPPDMDHEDYVLQVCDELFPAALDQGGFDAVEVYCEETVGITMEDASTILETFYRKKIPTRVSADHLSDSAGGALAPAFYSKVAAHLNYTDDVAVTAMGRAGTTAVLLPGAAIELGPGEHRPPVDLLREHGVPIAVSTGSNPGSAPLFDLRLAAHLACSLFGLTLPEAVHGITRVAAHGLGLTGGEGGLSPGGRADLAVWDLEHPDELAYWAGAPVCRQVWAGGVPVWSGADG